MQEPTLFNYTVKENILYGNLKASNKQIYEACEIANALEFVESQSLVEAFDDTASSLKAAWESDSFKQKMIEKLGEDGYKKQLEMLCKLDLKEDAEGTFLKLAAETAEANFLEDKSKELLSREQLSDNLQFFCLMKQQVL